MKKHRRNVLIKLDFIENKGKCAILDALVYLTDIFIVRLDLRRNLASLGNLFHFRTK